jgi:cell filamentation protein
VANYTYPGTNTVKNKLGVIDHAELERIESRLVAGRIYELTLGHGLHGRFDADHLRAIHRHLFQDVYEWAGHTRDERVPLSDGTIATEPVMHKQGGGDFLVGRFIPGALDGFAKMLRDADYLRGLSRENFVARAADIMAFLNAVHPFREATAEHNAST